MTMNRMAALLALAGCAACNGGPVTTPADDVEVRVSNLSAVDFDSVLVVFPAADTQRYGPVRAGMASAYARVQQAYRYAYVEVWAQGRREVLQPIDFVGESPLQGGKHTYGLTWSGEPPRLGIVMADQMAGDGGILFLAQRVRANEVMEALYQGPLQLDGAGCLRLGAGGATVVWPFGFTVVHRGTAFVVRDASGGEVTRVGGQVKMGGGEIDTLPAGIVADDARAQALERCPGKYWITGEIPT